MRRNVGLRIISVVIAIGLWIFVNAGQRGAVETLSVPLSYRSIPPGLIIVNHPPDFVKVEVTGPRTLLSLLDPERMALQRVEAEPLELKGDTADVEARLALVTPNQFVRLGASRIAARLHVGEVITNREFRAIPVEVRDTDFKFRISPQKASVTLRGPALKLDSLDPKGLVYVDAKGGDPGAHDLPLQVDLPDGMQLVKQNPDKIKLRIYREKRTDINDGKTS